MFEYAGAAGRNRPQRIWDALHDNPSAVLLAVQLSAVLLYPFTTSGGLGRTFVSILGLAVLVLAVAAVRRTPATTWIAWVLGVPVFVLTIAEAVAPGNGTIELTSAIAHSCFYFFTGISLLRYMFADIWVSRDELFATAACFTVLAWAWAYTHDVVQLLWPGSYVSAWHDGALSWNELLFLSFTTLTNTGLSDISVGAEANQARAVLMLQMMMGIFYVGLVVARLLGLTMIKFRR
ncbi:ion channel [Ornithinicoccus hortensis]|uniref:Ion channel n=1 Tax=Ornithinicoccus hortensis TaxID=82346 RepID=A0A542YU77_9MICO|nr:ion channel [Ornithinicoccus hortensis]TQL51636.1 ion channel [Ornithinicoccus hortensis]